MTLLEQVTAIIFSYMYGGILSVLYNFNYNLLFSKKSGLKILFNIIFIFDLVLIYFLIMKKINLVIIHPYFYLIISLGFFTFFNFTKSFRKYLKIKYTKKKMPKSVKKN